MVEGFCDNLIHSLSLKNAKMENDERKVWLEEIR